MINRTVELSRRSVARDLNLFGWGVMIIAGRDLRDTRERLALMICSTSKIHPDGVHYTTGYYIGTRELGNEL
jgi:hypothetical protein